ncbi:MAG TPA: Gfo/Idh/MocA family oxidoreductase [Streptosporangiaceae bacterium]|nr:Gfo/Idh/MocA family oxidoreductase [Streptosporangiaceae bacterium]
MTTQLGVGIVGAGPVTQAIHLPTLARLPDLFRVTTIMDVDAQVAESVAARTVAQSAQSLQAVLENPGVDVVAVCSPHQFHAEQVAAICAAGKRGILCEKPLATSRAEAEEIRKVVEAAGIPLVVGAMHSYDPGWLAAFDACAEWLDSVHTIRSTIVLPLNDRYEDWATEIARRPAPPADSGTPGVQDLAQRIRGLVLGLSVHDLPLVRAIAPTLDRVDHAEFVTPFGGVISAVAAGRRLDLIAFMRPVWRPDWRFEVWGEERSMSVQFTPSYVHAGSASATITDRLGERHLAPQARNGYEGEWMELHDLVSGAATPRYPLGTIVDDLAFASDIADEAASAVLRGGSQ